MTLAVATGPADVRDQRWLDERIAAIEDGVEAVIDIARNWSDGRNLSRLHPGVAAAAYVTERVGVLGKSIVPVLLAESNWSNRQIAAVAGVDEGTVRNVKRTAESSAVAQPVRTLGADGKVRPAFRPRLDPNPDPYYAKRTVTAVVIDRPSEEKPIDAAAWSALGGVIDAIESLAGSDAAYVAAAVPERRRAATAKRLRKLGTYLGRIAWTLEGQESSQS